MSHSPVVSKIDNRLEQYTSAAQVSIYSTVKKQKDRQRCIHISGEVDSVVFISVSSKTFGLSHLGLQEEAIYQTPEAPLTVTTYTKTSVMISVVVLEICI